MCVCVCEMRVCQVTDIILRFEILHNPQSIRGTMINSSSFYIHLSFVWFVGASDGIGSATVLEFELSTFAGSNPRMQHTRREGDLKG